MMVDDVNKKGGLLGKKVEAVVVDPASNWPLFAEKARDLLSKDKVAAVFGCWTSVSRKSVLPVFEELNGLLFYPVQYEGKEELEQRFLYRRGAKPAGDPRGRKISDEPRRRVGEALGPGGHRLRLSPHHEQDPRGVSRNRRGWRRRTSRSTTRPLGNPTGRPRWPRSRASPQAGKKTAVVSTINGDADVPSTKNSPMPASRRPKFRSSRSRSVRRNWLASTRKTSSAI